MKSEHILPILEETAEKLGIRLRYEDLKKGEVDTQGGSFVLKGEKYVFVHKYLPAGEKVRVIEEALAEMDTSYIHIAPEIRERLERVRNKKRLTEVHIEGY